MLIWSFCGRDECLACTGSAGCAVRKAARASALFALSQTPAGQRRPSGPGSRPRRASPRRCRLRGPYRPLAAGRDPLHSQPLLDTKLWPRRAVTPSIRDQPLQRCSLKNDWVSIYLNPKTVIHRAILESNYHHHCDNWIPSLLY